MASQVRRISRTATVLLMTFVAGPLARADSVEPDSMRRPISRGATITPVRRSESSGGWWIGTAGVALSLAVCGWASVASRKLLPKALANSPNLRVVGRTSLSPKHNVYLLDIGGRVLLIGTGPQGAPSLLGELEGDETAAAASLPKTLDIRVGDDL